MVFRGEIGDIIPAHYAVGVGGKNKNDRRVMRLYPHDPDGARTAQEAGKTAIGGWSTQIMPGQFYFNRNGELKKHDFSETQHGKRNGVEWRGDGLFH